MLRPLLILDLDETLIYGVEKPMEHTPDFRVGPYLLKLMQEEIFRRVEKRFWRNDQRAETGT